MEAEGGGEAVATVQKVPLIALGDLGSAVGKSRLLCEGLWGRAFLTAYNSANDGERMAEGAGEGAGAGLALLAMPMVETFTFTQARFQRILSDFLGLEGAISFPHRYPPLRRRRDACPHARDGKSSASMPSAREELSST